MKLINNLYNNEICYINLKDKTALFELKLKLTSLINELKTDLNETVILCIGTDRATGDSLGPLVGYKLSRLPKKERVTVYGTLEKPVHAQNLKETTELIYNTHSNPFVIAIDASLGSNKHIGHISVGKGGLKPGSGVKKDLGTIGDMFITGIVNLSGAMEIALLQNTRLSVVMRMADIVTTCLWLSL